jgi:adenylate kinase
MLNIILFGPPGSGKGTQSKYIVDENHLTHISTGDLLRLETARKTTLGQEVKKYIDKGHLVPDKTILEIVKSRIEKELNTPGFVFDGFPRTIPQAEELDKILTELNLDIKVVLYLYVPNEEIIERLKKRAEISGRKDDASIDTISNRIAVYQETTSPLIEYYKKQGKTVEINGVGSIEEIAKHIRQALAKFI